MKKGGASDTEQNQMKYKNDGKKLEKSIKWQKNESKDTCEYVINSQRQK